jgi:hypothetical protein
MFSGGGDQFFVRVCLCNGSLNQGDALDSLDIGTNTNHSSKSIFDVRLEIMSLRMCI